MNELEIRSLEKHIARLKYREGQVLSWMDSRFQSKFPRFVLGYDRDPPNRFTLINLGSPHELTSRLSGRRGQFVRRVFRVSTAARRMPILPGLCISRDRFRRYDRTAVFAKSLDFAQFRWRFPLR